MKNILVTGGLGFIGHNVVQLLLKDSAVTVFDTETTYGFVPQDELDYLMAERRKKIPNATIYNIDIRAKLTVDAFIRDGNFDTIIHMASFPRQKVVASDPSYASEVMVTGLMNLLESATKHKVRKFVYISSSMVYGDFDNDVTEDAPCNPQGQYAIMKLMGEQLVKDYAARTGMKYAIIRPSAVYGEVDVEDRVVSKFVLNAMRGATLKVNGPDEVLDFSYVIDTAWGIVLAALQDAGNNQTYNITRSDSILYTLADAARLAIAIIGKGDLSIQGREQGFPSRGRLSINKARRELGYDPKVSILSGFGWYHEWFKTSPYWQKRLK